MKRTALVPHSFIFDWSRPPWDYRLVQLILLSLGLHFAALYLFHVVYPSTTSLPPAAAQISVLNPKNAQDRRLLEWVELNDPAAISAPKTNDIGILKLIPSYRPTFADELPDIQRSQAANPTEETPSPSLFTPDNLFTRQAGSPAIRPSVTFASRFEFGGALKDRQPITPEKLPASQRVADPSVFFVGISKEGTVKYLFLWRSSGSEQLDHSAEEAVRNVRFQADARETWGTVSIHWGSVPAP